MEPGSLVLSRCAASEFYNCTFQGVHSMCARKLHATVEPLNTSMHVRPHKVLYCNGSSHSQQNRCLVSGKALNPSTRVTSEANRDQYVVFFELLDRQFKKYESVLPVDLRARGIVSLKYQHNGTIL